MHGRRVVITGLGVVSPLGSGIHTFWENLTNGKPGIRKIQQIPDIERFITQIGGEVTDLDPLQYMPKNEIRRQDPFSIFGMCAAAMAFEHAGMDGDHPDPFRIGVIMGSGIGGLQIHEEMSRVFFETGPSKFKPLMIPQTLTNMLPGRIAIRHGCKGPNFSIASACSSGNHAIGESLKIIQSGEADVMVAGGAESAITHLGVGGFCALRAMSTRNDDPEGASRPFDAERDGFVISEGAAVLILEELERAKHRGAEIYAEVVGYGRTSDAFHITAPPEDAEPAARCIQRAMEDGEFNPDDVDYINAHGTSTRLNDAAETKAIKIALGTDRAKKTPVSSNKSMFGHALGAAGALEGVASVLTIYHGIVPPTINYENPDSACDLDYVPNTAREIPVSRVLSNSFGFGGHNTTIALKKYS
jgi:3-oxoacyl-[acyl-carrier-protein] synthase II